MSRVRRTFLLNALKLWDLIMMVSCFLLAALFTARQAGSVTFAEFLAMRIKVANIFLFLLLLVVWHVVLSMCGLYGSRRISGRRTEAIDAFKATSLGTLLIGAAALLFHIRMLFPGFLPIFWAATSVTAICYRLLLRTFLESIRRRGRNLRHMLIVGTNSRALEFADKIQASPGLGYRITGFVDRRWAGLESGPNSKLSVLCDLNNLGVFLRGTAVDEVVIALPMASLHSEAAKIAALCEEQGITTRVLSSFDLKLARATAEEFEGAAIVTHYIGLDEGWQLFMKRILDVLISIFILLALSPVLLIITILIRLTSPGPVLFAQHRVGFNKHQFRIYKFRTMIQDAEYRMAKLEEFNEVSGPVFKIKNDPRITTLGKILRRTSLDELPQLLNVLKGDMSLVGPRPLPVRDYQGFNEDWQRRRFSIRPGITCLWQIRGRSAIPFEQWMQLDLQYIDEWSLWLDMEILLRTIPAVLKGAGAA
jgi:exopolysaccharide biosynthesis polyprenyl glycosylphosphotransferase